MHHAVAIKSVKASCMQGSARVQSSCPLGFLDCGAKASNTWPRFSDKASGLHHYYGAPLLLLVSSCHFDTQRCCIRSSEKFKLLMTAPSKAPHMASRSLSPSPRPQVHHPKPLLPMKSTWVVHTTGSHSGHSEFDVVAGEHLDQVSHEILCTGNRQTLRL